MCVCVNLICDSSNAKFMTDSKYGSLHLEINTGKQFSLGREQSLLTRIVHYDRGIYFGRRFNSV